MMLTPLFLQEGLPELQASTYLSTWLANRYLSPKMVQTVLVLFFPKLLSFQSSPLPSPLRNSLYSSLLFCWLLPLRPHDLLAVPPPDTLEAIAVASA